MAEQLFVVFPENKGVCTATSDLFEVSKIDSHYLSDLSGCIRKIRETFEVEDYVLLYDRVNVENYKKAFVHQYEDKKKLRTLISVNGLLEWNDETCAIPGVCNCINIFGVPQYKHNSLCEAAIRQKIQIGIESIVVLHYKLPKMTNNSLPVLVGKTPLSIHIRPMELADVHKWISKYRLPQRRYLWNKKHGENGHHVIPNQGQQVSILLSSRQEAEMLLPYAIGQNGNKKLYMFDGKYNRCEEFMPSNDTYHSYHVSKTSVPDKILKNLEYILNIKIKV